MVEVGAASSPVGQASPSLTVAVAVTMVALAEVGELAIRAVEAAVDTREGEEDKEAAAAEATCGLMV